jgi:hypothetical protein
VCPGSEIHFFKNGVSMGVAFRDVYVGTYYPAVSLYYGASVAVNFGPTFAFPPPTTLHGYPVHPCSELPNLYRTVPTLTTLTIPAPSAIISSGEGGGGGSSVVSSVTPVTEPQTSNLIVHHRDTNSVTLEHTQKTLNNRTDVINIKNDDKDRNKDNRKRDEPIVQSTTESRPIIRIPTILSQSASQKL